MKEAVCIAVVYHSITGTTANLADAVSKGAAEIEATSVLNIAIEGEDIECGRYRNAEVMERLEDADAIVFGSPTFMGCVSAQFKAFADATSDFWEQQDWRNKVAAGFTVGSNPCGDLLNTIQYLSILANQHGMLWVGIDLPGGSNTLGLNLMGAQSGLIVHAPDNELKSTDIATAKYLGSRVARLTRQLLQ